MSAHVSVFGFDSGFEFIRLGFRLGFPIPTSGPAGIAWWLDGGQITASSAATRENETRKRPGSSGLNPTFGRHQSARTKPRPFRCQADEQPLASLSDTIARRRPCCAPSAMRTRLVVLDCDKPSRLDAHRRPTRRQDPKRRGHPAPMNCGQPHPSLPSKPWRCFHLGSNACLL